MVSIEMYRIGNTPPNLILTCFIEDDKLVASQPKMVKDKPANNENIENQPKKRLRSESGGIRLIQNNGAACVNASQINPGRLM